MVEDEGHDVYLNQYISLVLEAQASGKSIFSGSVLDQPDLFTKYVSRYIIEGVQERAKINAPPDTEGGA